MGKVFFDAHGKPGVLYSGDQVGHRARTEIDKNGGKVFRFTDVQLRSLLYHGEFKYGTSSEYGPSGEHGSRAHRHWLLNVEGMDDGDGDYFATGDLNGDRVCFNYSKHQITAEALASRGWPADSQGVDMLAWFTAATMLHEIMHNHGFTHPKSVNYTPGSDYACSLPYIAERAVLRCSPYWSIFENYYDNSGGIWLASGGELSCRCKIKEPLKNPLKSIQIQD